MSKADGFEWEQRESGDIVVRHDGTVATTLCGRRAQDFLDDIAAGDEQELMARLTGDYKRGNERQARQHPRNSDRTDR